MHPMPRAPPKGQRQIVPHLRHLPADVSHELLLTQLDEGLMALMD